MTADIARVTYDPTRQYRSVISQQGRVTLEADCNESAILETEALRLETIDIVGPSGTPDNGYKVGSGKGQGGVGIGTGIFYLGGWRLENDQPIDLSQQPDWLDAPPLKIAEGTLLSVALLLTEQSVCAVEDQALREVALGGPDSAARRRLLQRFLCLPIQGSTCAAGTDAIAALLKEESVTIDPTCQLISSARLKAGFVPGPATTDPCQPAAAGGYLGADNQMVRVTVTNFAPPTQTGTLLWGWNNASLLYRASATDAFTLTLTTVPVDQEHAPQQNQIVEILRSTAKLGDPTTNLADANYIADGEGLVFPLKQGYSSDTQEIKLNSLTGLPKEYQNDPYPLFVRLWQAEVNFQAGKPTPLDSTSGITVAITMDALPSQIAARPFWHFAVRPSTSQNIYPQRYTESPQPPDGPRQWIAELAVVQAQEQGSTLLANCRIPFLPLTKQSTGCCALVLGPDDVAGRGGLQAVVDSLAGQPAVLSLRPGTYPLTAPLTLRTQHNDLTIEGCTSGVTVQAAGSDMTPFRIGLVVIDGANDVTLRRLGFSAPIVPAAADAAAKGPTNVAVSVKASFGLSIESCRFDLNAHSADTTGYGIIVLGLARQVTLKDNNFIGPGQGQMYGVFAQLTAKTSQVVLDQWDICGNTFQGFFFGIYGVGHLGLVSCRLNIVKNCANGLVLSVANLGTISAFARAAFTATDNSGLGPIVWAALRPDLLAQAVAVVAPIEALLPAPPASNVPDAARKLLADEMRSAGAALYKTIAGSARAAAAGDVPARAAIDTSSLDVLDAVSLAAELTQGAFTPTLRFADNEVQLSFAKPPPSLGLSATLSRGEQGTVVVTGNRVLVPDSTMTACSLNFPSGAVVTGNYFAQLLKGPQGSTVVPSLSLIAEDASTIMVAGNVSSFGEKVTPQRSSQAAATTWEFLNTTG